ncbi:M23 family metallopeptidase [Nocardioides sp. cx-173]|uniref:M23 family metallopeptidase n=1 Tax=Nocardioides sp. cx-173 TaxID=2898796 RepID=UPI001E31B61C|nr:M23 family metallopeptidase [Nocardioides sp. cx-173]MCD4524790.1 peptidoglycan DD-metalloendopeptidase family protein [Nocardioides sp. cx-173]UGB43297.1 peptidoglycan DD-metalloendopeptidase family protein [Nocardioides sp. cx-173]
MRRLASLAPSVALSLGLLCGAPSSAAADEEPRGSWPLRPTPEVVQRFDPPETPYGAGHRGVDLAGAVGQPVRSALPGTVRYAGRLAGRGVVVVRHGATRTTYEPVTSRVEVGRTVAAGEVLGALELAGSHCFPRACLHWGWIQGETYLDPLRLVGAGPVRLLPLWSLSPAPVRAAAALPYAGLPLWVAWLTSLGRAAGLGGDAITAHPPP